MTSTADSQTAEQWRSALRTRDLSAVERLLGGQRKKPTVWFADGYTPLHVLFAMEPMAGSGTVEAMLEIAQLLLQRGADPNARSRNPDGTTPLILACTNLAGGHPSRRAQAIPLLLQHGGDPRRVAANGFGCLSVASQLPWTIAQQLAADGAPGKVLGPDGNPLRAAARLFFQGPHIDVLLRAGADPNQVLPFFYAGGAPYPGGAAAMHVAIDERTIDALVAAGGDVNVQDWLGARPLHHHAFNFNCYAVPALLRHGADLEGRDQLGRTPLLVAARANVTEAEQAVLELVRLGANPLAVDSDRRGLAHSACARRPGIRTLLASASARQAIEHTMAASAMPPTPSFAAVST